MPFSKRNVSRWLKQATKPEIFGVQPSRFLPLNSWIHSSFFVSLSFLSSAASGAGRRPRSENAMARTEGSKACFMGVGLKEVARQGELSEVAHRATSGLFVSTIDCPSP